MAEVFDPYHKWLGIPPAEQPPNFYRLLGVPLFEADPDVIDAAANQRMMHLRCYGTSQHVQFAQELLNEVSAAKLCLLNPEKRQAYDRAIETSLPAGPTAAQRPPELPVKPPPASVDPALDRLRHLTDRDPSLLRSRVSQRLSRPRVMAVTTTVVAAIALLVGLFVLGSGRDRERSAPTLEQASQLDEDASGSQGSSGRDGDSAADDFGHSRESGQSQASEAKSANAIETPGPNNSQATEIAATKPLNGDEHQDRPVVVEPSAGDIEDTPEFAQSESIKNLPATSPSPVPNPNRRSDSPQSPGKIPVPSTSEQHTVAGQLDDVFHIAEAKRHEEKLKLAQELLKLGGKAEGGPTERFVILRNVIDLAASAGDSALVVHAVDAIDGEFDVDVLKLKSVFLVKCSDNAITAPAIASLVKNSREFIEQASSAQRYDLALEVVACARRATQRSAGQEYRKETLALQQALQERSRLHEKLQDALMAVERDPKDGDANTALGRLLCFSQGEWKRGLPYLAKGSDAALAELAGEELDTPPTKADEQMSVGDDWWEYAQASSGEEKKAMMLRAGYWYRQVQPNLTSSVLQAKVERRLAEIGTWSQQSSTGAPKTGKQGRTLDTLVPGLLVLEYERHARQASDVRVFVPETELGQPMSTRVDPLVDGTWALHNERNGVAKGFLRIERMGVYGFTTYGHYSGYSILIVGNTIIEQDKTENGGRITPVVLRPGMVPFQSIGRVGNRKVDIRWQPPGTTELSPLSGDVVFCKPVSGEKAGPAVSR